MCSRPFVLVYYLSRMADHIVFVMYVVVKSQQIDVAVKLPGLSIMAGGIICCC
jgi:hypothetical protein